MNNATGAPAPASEEHRPQDRRAALIALAVQPPAAAGQCPSAEELAAFSDGRLAPAARARLLAHLDACPACFQEWLTVSSVQAVRPEETVADVPPSPSRVIRVSFRRPPARAWWSGFGLALAASLMVVWVWWPRLTGPTLTTQIAQAYREVLPAVTVEAVAALADRPLPWERPAAGYGVSAPGAAGSAARAFGSGLWVGRETLRRRPPQPMPALPTELAPGAGQDSWEKTEWAPYALLGRWLFLLQIACSAPPAVPDPLWEQQPATVRALQAAFRERPVDDAEAQAVLNALTEIEKGFEGRREGDSRGRVCAQIEQTMGNLTARLAPPGG